MMVSHASSRAIDIPLGQDQKHPPMCQGFEDAAAQANCSLVQNFLEDVLLQFVEKHDINQLPALVNVRENILELVNTTISLSLSPHLAVTCSALAAAGIRSDLNQRKPSLVSNGPVSFFVMQTYLNLPSSSDASISGTLCVIGTTEQAVFEVAEHVSMMVRNLYVNSEVGTLMNNISDFLLISSDYRNKYESLLIEQQRLMGALKYWQAKDGNGWSSTYEGLLAGNAEAQRFLVESEEMKKYIRSDDRSPNLYNLVRSLFLSSHKQRVNVLAEKFPLLLQATMRRQ